MYIFVLLIVLVLIVLMIFKATKESFSEDASNSTNVIWVLDMGRLNNSGSNNWELNGKLRLSSTQETFFLDGSVNPLGSVDIINKVPELLEKDYSLHIRSKIGMINEFNNFIDHRIIFDYDIQKNKRLIKLASLNYEIKDVGNSTSGGRKINIEDIIQRTSGRSKTIINHQFNEIAFASGAEFSKIYLTGNNKTPYSTSPHAIKYDGKVLIIVLYVGDKIQNLDRFTYPVVINIYINEEKEHNLVTLDFVGKTTNLWMKNKKKWMKNKKKKPDEVKSVINEIFDQNYTLGFLLPSDSEFIYNFNNYTLVFKHTTINTNQNDDEIVETKYAIKNSRILFNPTKSPLISHLVLQHKYDVNQGQFYLDSDSIQVLSLPLSDGNAAEMNAIIENRVNIEPNTLNDYIYIIDQKEDTLSIYVNGDILGKVTFRVNRQGSKSYDRPEEWFIKFNTFQLKRQPDFAMVEMNSMTVYDGKLDQSKIDELSPNRTELKPVPTTAETNFDSGDSVTDMDVIFGDFDYKIMGRTSGDPMSDGELPENWEKTEFGYILKGTSNSNPEMVILSTKSGIMPKIDDEFTVVYEYIFFEPSQSAVEKLTQTDHLGNKWNMIDINGNQFNLGVEVFNHILDTSYDPDYMRTMFDTTFPNQSPTRKFEFNKPYRFTLSKSKGSSNLSIYVNSELWLNVKPFIHFDGLNDIYNSIKERDVTDFPIPFIPVPGINVLLRKVRFYNHRELQEKDLDEIQNEDINYALETGQANNEIIIEQIKETNKKLILETENLKREKKIVDNDLEKKTVEQEDTTKELDKMTFDFMKYLENEFNEIVKKEQEARANDSKHKKKIGFYKKINKWLIGFLIIFIVIGIGGVFAKRDTFSDFSFGNLFGYNKFKYTSAYDFISRS